MKPRTFYLLSILLGIWLFSTAAFAQQEQPQQQQGLCFLPLDYDRQVCIDFNTKWYYPVILTEWVVLYVRDAATPTSKHIWNGGQYLLTMEEWEKVKAGLAGKGLPEKCLHYEYRQLEEDQTRSRKEYCTLDG